MNVTAFHQTKHLPRIPAHLKSLKVELAGKRVKGGHYVRYFMEAVNFPVGSLSVLGLGPNAGVGLLDHLLAEVDADQIVLKDIVIEHVLGCFAKIDDPFGDWRRSHAEGHVLSVGSAGCVIVSANTADAAGNEMGIARIFALHEYAVTAKDRRRAEALRDLFFLKVNLSENSKAADNPGDGIPVHLNELPRVRRSLRLTFRDCSAHCVLLSLVAPRPIPGCEL